MYKISRIYFSCDDYVKSVNKIKRAEITSDITDTETETSEIRKRRHRAPPRRFEFESGDEENSDERSIPRPPKIPNIPSKELSYFEPNNSAASPSQVASTSTSRRTLGNINSKSDLAPSTTALSNTASPISTVKHDFPTNDPILTLLAQIKEQNKEILKILKKRTAISANSVLPDDIPIELPVSSLEDLGQLEQYLIIDENVNAVASYLATLGLSSKVNNILRRCLKNRVASNFSFFGKRDKQAFCDLNLSKVVLRAAKLTLHPDATEKDIQDTVKVWLKHSPQRLKAETKDN